MYSVRVKMTWNVIKREVNVTCQGNTEKAVLIIGPIRPLKSGDGWSCQCITPWPKPKESTIVGVDPLQALLLCIRHVALNIALAAERGVNIWCFEQGDRAGFNF